jgi:hypothetical protein
MVDASALKTTTSVISAVHAAAPTPLKRKTPTDDPSASFFRVSQVRPGQVLQAIAKGRFKSDEIHQSNAGAIRRTGVTTKCSYAMTARTSNALR